MGLKRMDHTGIVVEDLPAAIGFFVELGMELIGQALDPQTMPDSIWPLLARRTYEARRVCDLG